MKQTIKFFGLVALCTGFLGAVALLPQAQPQAQAATTFSPSFPSVIDGDSGPANGTNYGGLYPTSLAGNAGAASWVRVGAGNRSVSIQVQGKTVSSTSTLVVGLWEVVKPPKLALNTATGAMTNDATTPLQFVGWLTNACTTTPSCTVFKITDTPATPTGASASMVAAGQTFYVGTVTNYGSGVLTNWSVSAIYN